MLLPTIHFPGTCDEAISYYKETFGAQTREVAYFRDAPADTGLSLPPNFVMYSEVSVFGTLLSLSDGAESPPSGEHFAMTVFLTLTRT